MNILITGDFCPINRIEKLIDNENYGLIYNDFLSLIKDSDIAITNLECPLLDNGNKIEKTGPNIKASEKSINALTFAGFNIVTLANNHIMDFGVDGLNETLATLNKANIGYVGVGSDLNSARKPLFKNFNGINIAFINFCENEWSTSNSNKAGANPLSPVGNYKDIKAAKAKADYVLVIAHGGHEHYPLPSPRMQETYKFFVDAGADAVVGHHTHCFSGYEMYKGRPIFYSLGNFVFDWPCKRNSYWNRAYAVKFQLGKSDFNFTIHPYIQGDEQPGIRLANENEKTSINERLNILNDLISDSEKLEHEFRKYISSRKKRYLSLLEPYSNKYLKALFRKGIIPSFISNDKKKLILNLVRCESHRDVLVSSLEKD